MTEKVARYAEGSWMSKGEEGGIYEPWKAAR